MKFEYMATEIKTGRRVENLVEAGNISDLLVQLKQQGFKDVKIHTKERSDRAWKAKSYQFTRVSMKEMKFFTRQLTATLSAGLLLTVALEAVADDLENINFGKVIKKIREDILGGSEFSSALSKYPKIFSEYYVSVVKPGEATGALHQAMKELAQYLEDTERLHEKVKTALSYPAFVLGFAVCIVGFIVAFIIPKFKYIFDQMEAQLPLVTQAIFYISIFLSNNLLSIGLGLIGIIAAIFISLKFHRVRLICHILILRIPLIGKQIVHKAIVSRFCRTLSFLLEGGVPLSQSLQLTKRVVNHMPMQYSIDVINEHVIGGGMISEAIKSQAIFPKLVYTMTSIGEQTGKIVEMLKKTADYYDQEIDFSLQKLTALLEPVLIIIVGGIVLGIVVALYLPIFKISTLIR